MEREARREDVRNGGGNRDTVRQDQRQAEMNMRPTEAGTSTPAAERLGERRGATRGKGAGGREEADGGAAEEEHGGKRSREDARQEEDDGMGSENETQGKESMNVKNGRPKRKCTGKVTRGQEEHKERGEARRGARRGAAGRIRYIGSGAGKGRAVPLAQAIMVGRVCVVRTARLGEERTDAGRPRPDPG